LAAALGKSAAGDATAAPRCRRGKTRCRNRCIAARRCCVRADCRPAGSGQICQQGSCRCPRGKKLCNGRCVGNAQSCGGNGSQPPPGGGSGCGGGQRRIGRACWPDAEERAFVTLINNHRAGRGLAALTLQNQLGTAAELHSQDQAANGYLDHTGSDGSSPGDRLRRAGYSASTWGENVYSGRATADAAFAAWRSSSGHNENMLGSNFTQLGVGRAQGSVGTWYWTTTFGRPA
jgi:uncharacterized protein YkwD